MTLDPQLIRKSLAVVEPVADRVAERFYAKLFVDCPELRDMFPPNMDVQGDRLVRALVQIVADIEDPDSFERYLEQLGRDHRKFTVRAEDYHLVGNCLLSAIARYAGPEWTREVAAAWAEAYRVIASTMIDAAERASVYEPAWWTGEIVSHESRTVDIAVITIRTDQVLPYQAGQYVSIETTRWPRVWRSYSMANAPRLDRLLEFHVRAVGAGQLSSALVHFSEVGDLVRLGSATGRLVLDHGSQRDIVLVAGGTGLAPIKAILDDLTRTNRDRSVDLFFGARRREELYDLCALYQLAAKYPWLTVVPAVSHDPAYTGETGMIPDVVARYGDWSEHDVYACGSTEMIQATVTRFQELGVPPTRIRYDDFGAV